MKNKKYTRKQFITQSALAGIGLVLAACGMDHDKGSEGAKPDKDTILREEEKKNKPVWWVDKHDARYDLLRKGFNKRIDKFPLVIALCSSTDDVAQAIVYAGANGLPVAVKSGGHSMEGFSCNDGGLVINLSKMNGMELLDDGRLKAGPGCTLSEVYDFLLPNKRLLPAGSCAGVALGGLTLGGGYGLFSREYGLTCDHLVGVTMVDGAGKIHSGKDDPELLWALRGGGAGNFGVVTEMVFETRPAPTLFRAHYLKARSLDASRACALLKTWMDCAAKLPNSCFSAFVLNGATLNILVTDYDASDQSAEAQLAVLKGVTEKYHSTRGSPGDQLPHFYGARSPLYFRNSSAGLFKDFDEIAELAPGIFEKIISTPGMIYQVNTMGGKIADAEFEKKSAYPHRAYGFISELQAYWQKPAQEKKLAEVTSLILDSTAQAGINAQYVNYCSLKFNNWTEAYYGNNYERLQAVKKKYDPHNTIRHPQSIASD